MLKKIAMPYNDKGINDLGTMMESHKGQANSHVLEVDVSYVRAIHNIRNPLFFDVCAPD
jgi:hypothetical protein